MEKIQLSGTARLLEVQETEVPGLLIVVIASDFEMLRPNMKKVTGSIEMDIVVSWSPDIGILDFSARIEVRSTHIRNSDERFAVLAEAANRLNYEESDDVGKIVVYRDQSGEIVSILHFSTIIPEQSLQTPEGIQALQIVLGANMTRLYGGSIKMAELLEKEQKAVVASKRKFPKESRMVH